MTDFRKVLVKGRRVSIGVPHAEDGRYVLCYLHDWGPPKPGQVHPWEPGKNVFPDVHAIYDTWQQAEKVRNDMVSSAGSSKDKYWVRRVREEDLSRLEKVGAL